MTPPTAVLIGNGLSTQEGRYKSALQRAGYRIVDGDTQPEASAASVTVALLAVSTATDQVRTLRQRTPGIRLLLVGDPLALVESSDLALASAPVVAADATDEAFLRLVAFAARDNGWLLAELSRLDRNAKQLVGDDVCQWVKARPGIIGIVRFAHLDPVDSSTRVRQRLADHAYGLLDRLPRAKLSFQDVWNITLLIAVPLKQAELVQTSGTGKSLVSLSRDVTGSRKLILWFDQSLAEYFGTLGEGRHFWKLSTDDPLRERLDQLAVDSEERLAADILFKGRISQEDVDELIRVLSREHDQEPHD